MNKVEINQYEEIEAPGYVMCQGSLEIGEEEETEDTSRTYGRLATFLYRKGEPLIVIGPNWGFFITLLFILILIYSVFFSFMWDKTNFFVLLVGEIGAIVQLSSFIYTSIVNPGLPHLKYEKLSQYSMNYKKCEVCSLWINTEGNTKHCYECQVCIEGFDHHCPWTSKCVGKENLRSFYIFIVSTMVTFGFIILTVSVMDPNV